MHSPQFAWRDHMTGVLWFIGGMLITTLVVGTVVIATRTEDMPLVTVERPQELTPVELVHCAPDTSTETLVSAAACGRIDAVREQLARGADVAQTDPRALFRGRTALHHAVQRGDETAVQLLLAAGALPDARDAQGNTPLHLLALSSVVAHPLYVARFLIDAGARVDIRNDEDHTPLETLEADHMRLVERQDMAQMLLRTQRAAADETTQPAAALEIVRNDDSPNSIAPDAPEDAVPAPLDGTPVASHADTPAEPPHAAIPPSNIASPVAAAPRSHTPPVISVALPPKSAVPVTPAPPSDPPSPPTPLATAVATPVPAIASPTPPPSAEIRIRARLDAWAKAWADKDMAAYFDAYAPEFAPGNGLSMFAWRAQREARIAGKGDAIDISLSDIAIEQDGDTARIDLVQHYRAGNYTDVSRKRIEMTLHEGRWCIVAERETG